MWLLVPTSAYSPTYDCQEKAAGSSQQCVPSFMTTEKGAGYIVDDLPDSPVLEGSHTAWADLGSSS